MKKLLPAFVALMTLSNASVSFAEGNTHAGAAKSSTSTTHGTDLTGNDITHHDIYHTPEESYKEGLTRGRYHQYLLYYDLFSELSIDDSLLDELIANPAGAAAKKSGRPARPNDAKSKSAVNGRFSYIENDHHYDEASLNRGMKDGMADYERKLLHDPRTGEFLTSAQHFNMGLEAVAAGKFETALLRFNIVIKTGGENDPYYKKALWYNAFANMNIEYRGRIALTSLITNFKKFDTEVKIDSLFYIGNLLVDNRWPDKATAEKYHKKAVTLLSKWTAGCEKNKNYQQALLKLGMGQEKIEDYNGAYHTYKKILAAFPNSTTAKFAEERMAYISIYFPY